MNDTVKDDATARAEAMKRFASMTTPQLHALVDFCELAGDMGDDFMPMMRNLARQTGYGIASTTKRG